MSPTTPVGSRADVTKKWTEGFNSLASLVYKIAAAVGAVVTFLYLFSIDFFPQGLTPGEVVFFVFVALAFGFLYFALLLYGAFSSVWIFQVINCLVHAAGFRRCSHPAAATWPALRAKICRRKRCGIYWQRSFGVLRARIRGVRRRARCSLRDFHPLSKVLREPLLVAGSFFVFWLMALNAWVAGNVPINELFIGFFLGGFISLSLLPRDGNSQQTPPAWLRWVLAATVPLLIVVTFAKPTPLLHMIFQGLGIRAMQATIEIPNSEAATVERISELIERPIIDCRKALDGRLLIHGADVLWNGIGNQVLISFSVPKKKDRELFERDQGPEKQATIRLNSDQVLILKAKPVIDPCFDLPTDMLFESGSFKLSREAQRHLNQLVAAITALGTPSKLWVRGHSDPRPISNELTRTIGDNQRLSERRAETVTEALQEKLSLDNNNVRSEGVGSREPKTKCSALENLTRYESEQCNRPNRRVEIRIKLDRRSAEKRGSGGIDGS